MASTPLARKLLVKPGTRVLLVNAPAGYEKVLEPVPEGASVTARGGGTFDLVLGFATTSEQLPKVVAKATAALRPGGLLWIAYPKGTSKVKTDLNRHILHRDAQGYGLTGVTLVAIDDTWSAMRFRTAAEMQR